MKPFFIIFCVIALLSCKKSNQVSYQSSGVLTGYDLRMCASPACGGLLITINNDTAKNAPAYYHIGSTLTKLGISENSKFPINVRLNYKPDTGIFATYHYIVVQQIEVVK